MRAQTVTIDRRKPAEVVPQDKCWAIALFAGLIATILPCEPIRFESIGICVQLFIHFVLESRGQHHNIMHLRVTTTGVFSPQEVAEQKKHTRCIIRYPRVHETKTKRKRCLFVLLIMFLRFPFLAPAMCRTGRAKTCAGRVSSVSPLHVGTNQPNPNPRPDPNQP